MKQPLETAPRDGTPIRLFAEKWLPEEGVVVWYQPTPAVYAFGDEVGGGWRNNDGFLVAKFIGWEPLQSGEIVPFALPDEQLRLLTL